MSKLIDKLVVFGLCLLVMTFADIRWVSVVTMLVALAVSSLCGYFENKISSILCAGYIAGCFFVPELTLFLPLIVYDNAGQTNQLLRFCWIAALPFSFFTGAFQIVIAVVLMSVLAFVLHYRTSNLDESRRTLYIALDNAKENAGLLEQKNRDLMERQDYGVKIATLAERNRIAREIHDNVGHLLTRSLLQLGALRVTHGDDEKLTRELDHVKDALSDAMDSIRSSVHDLHGESVDLKEQLTIMAEEFSFCPVRLRYDAGELPVDIRYCFVAIVREALSNIARHSDAGEASVTVIEHPAICQLMISDNGTSGARLDAGGAGRTGGASGAGSARLGAAGIGLQNMADRVQTLGGVFRAEQNKGFRIFVSVPK